MTTVVTAIRVVSSERTTGMGAAHWTGIWIPSEQTFGPIGEDGASSSLGKRDGFWRYGMDLPPTHPVCVRYRSNSDCERVAITQAQYVAPHAETLCADEIIAALERAQVPGLMVFESIEEATRWYVMFGERGVAVLAAQELAAQELAP